MQTNEDRRTALIALLSAVSPPLFAQAVPDPLQPLDGAQRRALQAFLKRNSGARNEGEAQADQVALADLDGDGRPEVVLLWTFLGPTFSWSRVTVFGAAGSAWRERASADVVGQAEGLAVSGSEIRVATLTLGPNDARCCPSMKTLQRMRWSGGRLVSSSR